MYGKTTSEKQKKAVRESSKRERSEEYKKNISESKKGNKNGMYGKHFSEEAKQKQRDHMNNSIWIHNDELKQNKRINKNIIQEYFIKNWKKGRIKYEKIQ